ncbi:unnamed protein product [Notodromas monacha]|uniref:Transcription initiation factor TFIID subunit 12 n=1 Tax=Notodromas monacha TaxID=399045 RepID=A0A7R9BL15_9CRUS|nr:unnamed protein product [Notodromas monacha]CAG0916655.1 unnamed protein product [Notodromas monacha]
MNRQNTPVPLSGLSPNAPTTQSSIAPNESSSPSSGSQGASTQVSQFPSLQHSVFQLMTRSKLQEMVKEVDPHEQLDEEVEDLLLGMTDDFVENVIDMAADVAVHRGATTLETHDILLVLSHKFNMWIPGFGGSEETRLVKRSSGTEGHRQRLAVIRKSKN